MRIEHTKLPWIDEQPVSSGAFQTSPFLCAQAIAPDGSGVAFVAQPVTSGPKQLYFRPTGALTAIRLEGTTDATWGSAVLPRVERERALVRSRAERNPPSKATSQPPKIPRD